MNDKFAPAEIKQLIRYIFSDKSGNSLLGIPIESFFNPKFYPGLKQEIFGKTIATPIGVAAGPHTQLAQNIVAAWLCGARYIELKTIQHLDELKISKPCIDMQDEGYNCEWSQELKIHESYEEYLKAWIIIHFFTHKFGYGSCAETVFNMSVGYNYEGICKENVQWFFSKMKDCSAEKQKILKELSILYPEVLQINIPDTISDNVTLSTMHGCPPDEIEKIARYLIEEKHLHTFIKLNPTLLGKEEVKRILNHTLKYPTVVPDEAFEHDLKYKDAIAIIKNLADIARKHNIFFGIKLTNTLECLNQRNIFDANEKMMYMSGRALFPLSINLARKLQNDFNGTLNISYSGGADAFNIQKILSCGLFPVTVCSDLLKPGGYARLQQYIQNISQTEFTDEEKLHNLNLFADTVINDTRYAKNPYSEPNIKGNRTLHFFDCIGAPCVEKCPAHQDIPEYLHHTAEKDFTKALEIILKTNPLPAISGMVCTHECQTRCTRIHYDEPVLIREIKRFVTEQHTKIITEKPKASKHKAAIVGAGPSGLSCAFFLRLAGFHVEVYESRSVAGGMVSDVIPQFRISTEAIESDIERIKSLGVIFHFNVKIDKKTFEQLRQQYDFIYIAVGAKKSKPLDIEGGQSNGVIDPLLFLSENKKGKNILTGNNITIIGGGNTAVDVARTAKRLIKDKGKVSIVYRRSRYEMPAAEEEIKAALAEGIEILDFTLPIKIISENNKVTALQCTKAKAGQVDASGRHVPLPVEGTEFVMPCDIVIPAVGQDVVVDFIDTEIQLPNESSFKTQLQNVFIGGDAMRGASTIVQAIADGRSAAKEIITLTDAETPEKTTDTLQFDYWQLMQKRSIRQYAQPKQKVFSNVSEEENIPPGLTVDEAVKEAQRCLRCDQLCNICVTVCPNRANLSYTTKPQTIFLQKAVLKSNKEIFFEEDKNFVISQTYQTLNIADFCNECGNCTTFCPTSGSPFRDKPRFLMSLAKFKESENGFYLSIFPNKTVLIKKCNEEITTMTFENNRYSYENNDVLAVFLPPDFDMIHVRFYNTNIVEYSFEEAAEMYLLINAVKNMDIFYSR